jgi:hypothetical protein
MLMEVVLAFLSLMCTPMPSLFMKYGPYLRRKSRYAPSAPATPPPQGAVAATGVKGTSAGDKEKMAGVNRPDEALEPEWAADAGEHAGKELRGTEAV